MKTMSVLELDQHWPEAEKALKTERQILVTRDGETIGRLVPVDAETEIETPRKRFDPDEHRRRMQDLWESVEPFDSTPSLMEAREERKLA